MKFLSPAKLNLNLRVISKRNDGYHNLETTFQLINLFDEISFEESDKSFGISCDGLDIEPENNLIFKSLNAITKHCNLDKGIQIHLKKIIPAGAGLGGGSSNAATTLIALNKIWNLNLSTEELVNIGKGLGADVPIFIYGRNAVATGIGEEVLKTVGSFLVVELMRQGKTPQKACEIAIGRILSKQVGQPNFQVAYIATNNKGEIGAFSIQKGFSYTQHKNKKTNNVTSNSAF